MSTPRGVFSRRKGYSGAVRHEIPLTTIHDRPTPYVLALEADGETVRLEIDEAFAGRRVEEELPRAALVDLLAGGPRRNDDLLGLTLETDGGERVTGLVSVGSGNERFALRREDLAAALDAIG